MQHTTAITNVTSVSWSPNGQNLAVGTYSDLSIYYWNGQTLTQVATPTTAITNVNSVSWSPDGQSVAAGTTSNLSVYSWNGQALTQVATPAITNVNFVSWSPDGQSVAAGTNSHIYVYPWTISPTACTLKNNLVTNSQANGNAFGIFGSGFANVINNNQSCNNDINYGGGVFNIQYGYTNNGLTVSNAQLQNVSLP